VSVGLQAAALHLGSRPDQPVSLTGLDVLVVGAGAMSGLAVAQASRARAGRLVVANRTRQRAERLAASAGGHAADMSALPELLAAADLVVTCTGAAGQVITDEMVRTALAARPRRTRPLVFLDLAMPRDVDPGAAARPGVVVVDLDTLAGGPEAKLRPGEAGVAEVRGIMTEELAAYASASRAASVSPTVVALRAKAARVVEAELSRLAGRLDNLDARSVAEVAKSMRRIADKLLHDPTVRVKELAGAPGADSYEDALRVLFDLDPATVQAVAQADAQLAGWPQATSSEEDGR
jgi:glutamyl-tRNA reductase